MRSIKRFVSLELMKVIYYAYFQSKMSYGIIFWGHSSLSIKVFRLQKRILRILMGIRNRDSCRKLFINLKILPLPSASIFSVLRFVAKNKEIFTTNNEIHDKGTRQHLNFHYPAVSIMKYQTGVHYMGVKIFNKLPTYIKNEFTNSTKFISLVQKFFSEKSFYSLEEYYNSDTKKY